jgi:hypothetical protein
MATANGVARPYPIGTQRSFVGVQRRPQKPRAWRAACIALAATLATFGAGAKNATKNPATKTAQTAQADKVANKGR